MAFDFPNAPVSGQVFFDPLSGAVYTWNGQVWLQSNQQSVRTARNRNRVINPTAQISQENGTTAVTAINSYPADQWALNYSGIVAAGQRLAMATPSPEGTTTSVGICATTAKGSLAASDLLQVLLPIEGLDVADLGWGTAQAKAIVLRFLAVSNTAGTYGLSITNSANNRCYCSSFTLTAASTNQIFSLSIPGDTSGTWLKDTGVGLFIRFASAAGATFQGATGWSASNFLGPIGMTNGVATANSYLVITDVGLYKDVDGTGTAPPFEAPSYEDDLQRCMRYWQRPYGSVRGDTPGGYVGCQVVYSPLMRATPSQGTLVDGGTVQAAGKFQSYIANGNFGSGVQFASGANIEYWNYGFNWTANARLA